MSYSVGEVSRLANVSIRTLHHYDGIGLVAPNGRTDAGYRLYSDADVARLAQVLFYRELGFSLQNIAVILDDPASDVAEHLRRQKELLRDHVERLEARAAAITQALEAIAMNEPVT